MLGSNPVDESIRESSHQATSNIPADHHPHIRMVQKRIRAPLHLSQKRDPKTEELPFVILGGIVQLEIRQSLKNNVTAQLNRALASR